MCCWKMESNSLMFLILIMGLKIKNVNRELLVKVEIKERVKNEFIVE